MIRFRCPKCSRPLSAPEEHAGSRSRCRGCKQAVTVPLLVAPPASPITVHVEREAPDQPSTGPAAVATLVWMVVLIASIIVCGGIGIAGWFAFHMPMPAGSPLAEHRLLLIFLIASLLLIPLYIAARAIDRLSQ